MTETQVIFYIYGLCTMFYGIMTWTFWRKGGRLSKLVALLMGTLCVQCVKDLYFIGHIYEDEYTWAVITSFDIVAVPMYAFILMELVKPGTVSKRQMILHEIPFVLLPPLYIATGQGIFYYLLVGGAAAYGTYFLLWTTCNIPRYNRQLKELFSYTENINLNWLRVILYSFYLILSIWILTSLAIHIDIESLYMGSSLVMWIIIDFFIYKHESVLDELREEPKPESDFLVEPQRDETEGESDLSKRIALLFHEQQIFLNPQLKVSDVAMAVGTNRTYVSNYFNREIGSTFYDYVNNLRVEHSCQLLRTTNESIKCIAEKSGFNSPQAFIRVFTRTKGITPSAYRSHQ